jgi:signal peptidase I
MAAGHIGRAAGIACVAGLVLAVCVMATGRVGIVRVAGGSMAPALWPGDVCLVTRVARPSASDIVLFTDPGHASRVLHRVRAVNGPVLVTQGDANPVCDRNPLPASAVIGRVVRVLPVGRMIREWQAARGR